MIFFNWFKTYFFLYDYYQIIDIFTSIAIFNQDSGVTKILKTYRIIQHELLT